MESLKQKNLPEKKNIFFMLILSIITLGIYPCIWYIKRCPEFENLGTEKKLRKSIAIIYLIVTILYVTLIIIQVSYEINSPSQMLKNPIEYMKNPPELSAFQAAISASIFSFSIILLLLFIFMGFTSRAVINEVLNKKITNKEISFLLTMIFNFYYIQYEINRIVQDKENEKRISPWICFSLLVLVLIALIFFIIY